MDALDARELFLSKHKTVETLKHVAARHGIELFYDEAYDAWGWHSADMEAEWLVPDAADPEAEMLLAARKYIKRRNY